MSGDRCSTRWCAPSSTTATVKGNIQAGAVTYFALHLVLPDPGAGVRGHRLRRPGLRRRRGRPGRRDQLGAPRVSSARATGQISLSDIRDSAPGILSVGIVVVLYSGLGWLSSMRDALIVMFELPEREQPNFIVGKVRDLIALALARRGADRERRCLRRRPRPLRGDPRLGGPRVRPGLAARADRRRRSAWPPTRCSSSRCSRSSPIPTCRGVALWSGRDPRRRRVRGAQAGLAAAAAVDGELAGVPGLRHRADPRRLDQLLLPGGHVRRLVGLRAPRRLGRSVPKVRRWSRGRRHRRWPGGTGSPPTARTSPRRRGPPSRSRPAVQPCSPWSPYSGKRR